MTYTYSGTAVTTDLAKVRLEIGDVDSTAVLFTDEEIQVFIDREGAVLPAAAAACDALSRAYARAYDFSEDGQSFSRSQMSKQYAQLALTLRRRAASGVETLPTTRVDGYSQTDDYDDVDSSGSSGRVRIGYTDPDLPL